MTTRLTLGVFTRPVLLDVARRTGAIASAGLEVHEHPVSSSPDQFRRAQVGELDAMLTNPDNTLAYRFDPANPLGATMPVRILAGIDRGLGLTLYARDHGSATRQRPRLGVDATTSGFALLAYALLPALGLSRESVELVALGSTPRRAAALVAGDCDLTILNAGNEFVAELAGCAAVGSVTDVGPYIGTVLAIVDPASRDASDGADRLGADERADAVAALRAVLLDTMEGIVSGDLAPEATASASAILELSADQAARHVAILRDERHGLIPTGAVDAASMETIIALRERFISTTAAGALREHWPELLS